MEVLGRHSKGKVINLMSNDVQTVENLGFDTHFLWIGTLETVVVLFILWSYIGVTIILAVLYTILVVFIQMMCGKVMQIIWYVWKVRSFIDVQSYNKINLHIGQNVFVKQIYDSKLSMKWSSRFDWSKCVFGILHSKAKLQLCASKT